MKLPRAIMRDEPKWIIDALKRFLDGLSEGKTLVPRELDVFTDEQLQELIQLHSGKAVELSKRPLPEICTREPSAPPLPPPEPVKPKPEARPQWMSIDDIQRAQAKAIVAREPPTTPELFDILQCIQCGRAISPDSCLCIICENEIKKNGAKFATRSSPRKAVSRERILGDAHNGAIFPTHTMTEGCYRLGPHDPDQDYQGRVYTRFGDLVRGRR